MSFSFDSDFESSILATRASNCLSLLASLVDRGLTAWGVSDGEWDLRRVEGGSSTADECDCDLFEKKKFNNFSRLTSRYSICTFSFCGAASLLLWASPWLRVVQVLSERMVASDRPSGCCLVPCVDSNASYHRTILCIICDYGITFIFTSTQDFTLLR